MFSKDREGPTWQNRTLEEGSGLFETYNHSKGVKPNPDKIKNFTSRTSKEIKSSLGLRILPMFCKNLCKAYETINPMTEKGSKNRP